MLPFGVTIPATVPQGSEIPEGLMNNPVFDNWGKNLSHKKTQYVYSMEMFTGRARPIRIIGGPANQLPD
jgi:hypothetical protein